MITNVLPRFFGPQCIFLLKRIRLTGSNLELSLTYLCAIFNDRISEGGNAIAHVRLSLRPFVSTLSMGPTGPTDR